MRKHINCYDVIHVDRGSSKHASSVGLATASYWRRRVEREISDIEGKIAYFAKLKQGTCKSLEA